MTLFCFRKPLLLAVAISLLSSGALADVKIKVEGVKGKTRANVLARMSLRIRAEKDELDEAQVRRLHQQARRDIRGALQPAGYYEPTIDSRLEKDGTRWNATYVIDRGPFVRLREIDASYIGEGADFPPLVDTVQRLPLRLDKRLRHAHYEEAKKAMSDAALGQGYLDATWVISELRVNPSALRSSAHLIMDTGPRYFFGPVSIEQDGLSEEFVKRYLDLQEGEPFNARKLLQQQFKLSDLGYFASVEIDPQRDRVGEDQRVPIRIVTTPRPRARWDFGVGYGTDTGARVSVASDWRRLNEMGHTINAEIRLSEIRNTIGATYRIPLGSIASENLSFSATSESEKLDAGDTLKYTLGASLNRTPGSWTRRLYLEYSHEESDLGDTFTTADLLTPGLSYSRSESDDPIFPRNGWYVFADVHGAVNKVLSSTTFAQSRLLGRGIYPLGEKGRLIGRVELGYSWVEAFGELPASQRFFAGGDQSVRGYAYESLGPTDANGNVLGGQYLNVYSLEAEHQVWGNWSVAAFYDAGGAGNDPGPKLSTGVGMGVRYRAPIGSLQLDLAHPMDNDLSGIRVHVGVRVGV